jgi:glycosyltransferase involved in cell wall biosynthesis
MEPPQNRSLKLLFLVTEDWYFWSHRLALAREAQRNGYSVIVATRMHEHGQSILDERFTLIPIRMRRRTRNPLREISSLFEIIRIYRKEKPDIVHHVAIKPVVYGSLAAFLAGVPSVVNAIAGLGYLFSSETIKAAFLRSLVKCLLKLLLNRPNTRTILQNPDDQETLVRSGIVPRSFTRLIRGSGVDQSKYVPSPEPVGTVAVIMASRMLWEKGVADFVRAATLLRSEGVHARFILAGESDAENPSSVPIEQLQLWRAQGDVEWIGKREDMPEVFASIHIVCLPSFYGEGIPKVLIEAASCGRPIVTTDIPGCREIVRNGENGILVPARNPSALASALSALIHNAQLRQRMGEKGRKMVLREFSEEIVIQQTLSLYNDLQE